MFCYCWVEGSIDVSSKWCVMFFKSMFPSWYSASLFYSLVIINMQCWNHQLLLFNCPFLYLILSDLFHIFLTLWNACKFVIMYYQWVYSFIIISFLFLVQILILCLFYPYYLYSHSSFLSLEFSSYFLFIFYFPILLLLTYLCLWI